MRTTAASPVAGRGRALDGAARLAVERREPDRGVGVEHQPERVGAAEDRGRRRRGERKREAEIVALPLERERRRCGVARRAAAARCRRRQRGGAAAGVAAAARVRRCRGRRPARRAFRRPLCNGRRRMVSPALILVARRTSAALAWRRRWRVLGWRFEGGAAARALARARARRGRRARHACAERRRRGRRRRRAGTVCGASTSAGGAFLLAASSAASGGELVRAHAAFCGVLLASTGVTSTT